MDRTAFTLPSFAKINWTLRILGKRLDGYHQVLTRLQTISLHDEIHFEASDNEVISLTCDDAAIPADKSNLIVRAAESLKDQSGSCRGARINLRKIIPAKAGLGGGSSNAAITLIGLARLWQLRLSDEDILRLASALGTDVPFFLKGGCVQGEGTGTALKALADTRMRHIIVITPNATVSTAEAYKALNSSALTTKEAETILSVSHKQSFSDDSDPWDVESSLANDFEQVIFEREPEINRAKSALEQAGAVGALLAGSGSSVFGIFEDLRAQTRALELVKVEPGWRVFPCVTISRREYSLALGLHESLCSF